MKREFSVPEPCGEDWGAMALGERGRVCAACDSVVHDFSSLTRREAGELFRKARGKRVCGNLRFDAAGEVEFRREAGAGRLVKISLWGAAVLGGLPAAAAESCAVEVKVTDVNGSSIVGARVGPGKTGEDGVFRGDVAEGVQELVVVSTGFKSNKVTARCDGGEPIRVAVELQVGSVGGVIELGADGRPVQYPLPLRLRIQLWLRRLGLRAD